MTFGHNDSGYGRRLKLDTCHNLSSEKMQNSLQGICCILDMLKPFEGHSNTICPAASATEELDGAQIPRGTLIWPLLLPLFNATTSLTGRNKSAMK